MDKKILFISPNFFDITKSIIISLENLGFKVDYVEDRLYNNTFYIFLIRVFPILNFFFKNIFINRVSGNYDYLFVINGEGLHKSVVSHIINNNINIKSVFYTWDSFSNKKNNINIYNLFDRKYSFDIKDSNEFNIIYKPLFYFNKIRKLQLKYDYAFIGTDHSSRLRDLKNFYKNNPGKYFIHIYTQNKLIYFFKKYILFRYNNFLYKYISYNSINAYNIERIYGESMYVIDLNHNKQTGFTFRSIQCLVSNIKIITSNKYLLGFNNVNFIDESACIENPCYIPIDFEFLEINFWLKSILYE